MKEIVKHYSNDDITIAWKPQTCIHAAECVKALPNVYHPDSKPWMTIDQATTEELIDQIGKCPSGALSYVMNEGVEEPKVQKEVEINVDVMKNGPILINGTFTVNHADGSEEVKSKTTAFCRCGASNNKPFCDGEHTKIGFEG